MNLSIMALRTDERIPIKYWKKTTLNQLKQRLTVVDEVIDEWRSRSGLESIQRRDILNIYCNIGCSESSANMFMLNG